MRRNGFFKTQITIIVIALLYGCSLIPVPASNEPVSIPNTVTPVPSVISSSPTENVVLLHTFSGHSKRILDVAFSAQGEFLASSSQDMNIRLWNVESGQEVHAFQMNSVDMADIDISISRNLLASAEAIWDLESLQEIHVLERGLIYPGSVAFSPDGSTLALGLFEQQIMDLRVNIPLLEALDRCWKILADCFEPKETGIRRKIIDAHWPGQLTEAKSKQTDGKKDKIDST